MVNYWLNMVNLGHKWSIFGNYWNVVFC